MKTIIYTFCDGTISEVEVDDALYAIHWEMVQQEKRNHWKNTRRHISLDYLREYEIDIEDKFSDPVISIIENEEYEELHKAMTFLPDKQRELVERFFFMGMTATEIAEAEGVSQPAVSQRLATVYKKLKKLL